MTEEKASERLMVVVSKRKRHDRAQQEKVRQNEESF